ncbi:TlpA disulfide reductase family protein [uncultured Kordia sp.]|uniref:TlpA family protein disulfide reductase n=1 Tax=uncultured Kordia sp. TaxID=507699 RepID=UPI0026031976|nr:TlpA disulfide reductase family protein [uncultured Kordia sp.]
MKKFVLLTTALAIFSCKTEPKVDYVLLSGKIENSKGGKINISGNDFKHEIKVNEDGSFADTLHIENAGYYSLNLGRERTSLYTQAGDDLKVTLDAAKFDETIKYEGKGAKKNNYIAAKFLANEDFDFQKVYAEEEADFLKTIGDAKTKMEEALINTKGLSADFIATEKANINYEYLANLSRYPNYHPYFAKKENFEPSKDLLNPLKDVDFDNEKDFVLYQSYKEIASSHHMAKIYTDSLIIDNVSALKNLKSQSMKNELASQLTYFVSPSNKDAKKLYDELIAISDNEKFKNELTKKYDKVKNLVAGKISPKFDYENHKGGKTKLDDLQGKYVYIDVWATWCGPCLGEIPSLKKVEAEYHDKNIEFVSVSIDTKKAYKTWKEMVTEKQLGGVQVIADNAWKSKFVTDYAIEGIPRFILIDPEGNIVNADAPRPSDPKLVELFNELKI